MSLWTSLRHFLEGGIESHSIDKMALWGTAADIGDPVHAGLEVSQDGAQKLSVVWRCIDLISGTLAAMPADVVRKVGEIRLPVPRPPTWLEFTNPETSWFEHIERCMESLLLDGNAFVLITARDGSGFPSELWTLQPQDVQVRKVDGRIEYLWGGSTKLDRYGPSNPAGDLLHIRLRSGGGIRGLSPIAYARQAIGLGLVAEKFGSKFFGRGQQMSGVIQLPSQEGGRARSVEHINLMRETWEEAHAGSDKAHRPAILTGGATWQGITIPPEDAQFLQTRSFQVEDIGTRFFGVGPNFIGLTEKQSSWGPGLEQQSIALLRYTLLTHIVRLEVAHSTLVPRGQFLRLNHRGLLRADSETEGKVIAQKVEHGALNRNEWRALDDLPPIPGGDRYMVPANMLILNPAGEADVPPAPANEPGPSPNGNGRVTEPVGGG